MARGIAALGAEGRAEGVNVAEGHTIGFHVQLAGNGQARGLAEEILREVDAAVFPARRVFGIKRGHAEHFARAFAVAGRNQRSMHVHKSLIVEEFVDGLRRQRTDAEDRAEQVRARAQMRDGAQELDAVLLFLQRIIGRRRADDRYARRLQFERLLRRGRGHERAFRLDGAADVQLGDFFIIGNVGLFDHDLQGLEAGAVVQGDKSERFAVAHSAHPAADADAGNFLHRRLVKKLFDRHKHRFFPQPK